jgi:hypothetical protein
MGRRDATAKGHGPPLSSAMTKVPDRVDGGPSGIVRKSAAAGGKLSFVPPPLIGPRCANTCYLRFKITLHKFDRVFPYGTTKDGRRAAESETC